MYKAFVKLHRNYGDILNDHACNRSFQNFFSTMSVWPFLLQYEESVKKNFTKNYVRITSVRTLDFRHNLQKQKSPIPFETNTWKNLMHMLQKTLITFPFSILVTTSTKTLSSLFQSLNGTNSILRFGTQKFLWFSKKVSCYSLAKYFFWLW